MKVYHRTNAGEAILRDGFEDSSQIVAGVEYCGVWVSEAPFDDEYGDQVLVVELPAELFDAHEWSFAGGDGRPADVEAGGREALIPAVVLNRHRHALDLKTGTNPGTSDTKTAL